jgi:hypothetical protein
MGECNNNVVPSFQKPTKRGLRGGRLVGSRFAAMADARTVRERSSFPSVGKITFFLGQK